MIGTISLTSAAVLVLAGDIVATPHWGGDNAASERSRTTSIEKNQV
jgi:hypothetical protein